MQQNVAMCIAINKSEIVLNAAAAKFPGFERGIFAGLTRYKAMAERRYGSGNSKDDAFDAALLAQQKILNLPGCLFRLIMLHVMPGIGHGHGAHV